MLVSLGLESDASRALLSGSARIVWTAEAISHFDAMTKYCEHQGWGVYTTVFPELDKRTDKSLGLE